MQSRMHWDCTDRNYFKKESVLQHKTSVCNIGLIADLCVFYTVNY